MTQKQWVGVLLRSSIVLGIIVAVYYGLVLAIPLLYPFLIGWLIAMMIEPAISWLEKWGRIPRWASVFVILFFLLAIIFSLLTFLISELVVELAHLAKLLPSFLNHGTQFLYETFIQENSQIQRMIETIQDYLRQYPEHKQGIQDSIESNLSSLTHQGTAVVTQFLAGIGQFLSDLPYYLMVIVFITLATYFIALDWPRIDSNLQKIIPQRIQITSRMVFAEIKKAVVGFIRAQLTLITITGIIMFIGLLILEIPYAFTIAIIVGLVDLLPYLGVGTILIPWIVYLIFVQNYYWVIGLSIIYILILVVRQFLEPKLVASNVGLDPLLTLIAIFIGFKWFGVIGLILGPILTIMIIALYRAHVFRDVWQYIQGDNHSFR